MPADLVGDGNVFMLEVNGDSMIDAGIHDGDFVIIRQQPTAHSGEIVAAMIPSEFSDDAEATVKTIRHRGSAMWLEPANPALEPFEAPAGHRDPRQGSGGLPQALDEPPDRDAGGGNAAAPLGSCFVPGSESSSSSRTSLGRRATMCVPVSP